MAVELFIDGAWGTTGLEIRERLAARKDVARIELSESERKDPRARARLLNEAGIVILCLPDDAAREAVGMIENPAVRVIDASTAHRVARDWTFGFPELEPGQAERIARSKRVSNPGCYSTAFLALVRPLVRAGIVPADWPVSASGISGYSGGGRPMIEEFENSSSPNFVETIARNYALSLAHKHVPEMKVHSGLVHAPIFSPTVARYYRGMIVEVPLALWALPSKPGTADLRDALAEAYRGCVFIDVASAGETTALKTLDAEALRNSNKLKLYVFANEPEGQARLVAVLDNLGKGAGGAAVQNLNLMLGVPETTGLL
jgi:N-acetyl-gamma-glutamyl-phosphate reductase